MKHTKIVCTVGPASNTKSRLEDMISAGMNVARLNFSHGTHADHKKLIATVRQAAKASGKQVALLQDLQGPRIRTGEVPDEGIAMRKGEKIAFVAQRDFDANAGGKQKMIPMQRPELRKFVKKGKHITIQDGTMDLVVEKVADNRIYCKVAQGGVVKTHKGMNFPRTTLDIPVITKKDKEDFKFGISQNVDFVSLSFVKDDKNIRQLRRLIPKNKNIKIIPKIERAEAVENFDKILAAADGIMVARGDLGVELGASAVPLLQKEMIMKCVKAGKPVIVATQMLESMIETPRPTRAEAADVANAIIDHTDAIMLSGESAMGKYPVKAVQTMSKIAREVEKSRYDDLPEDIFKHRRESQEVAVSHAAVHLAESINARTIAVLSRTGNTAAMIAQLRPQKTHITVFTDDEQVLRQLSLVWGVKGFLIKKPKNVNDFIRLARKVLLKNKIVRKGNIMVVVSGDLKTDLALAQTVEI